MLFRILLGGGFAVTVARAIPDEQMTHKQMFAV